MGKLTKKAKLIQEKVELGKIYQVEEAVGLLTELSKVKFKESIVSMCYCLAQFILLKYDCILYVPCFL